jgi:hypothetical protein
VHDCPPRIALITFACRDSQRASQVTTDGGNVVALELTSPPALRLERISMLSIVMACNIDADADTVFRAISTIEGDRGWFTATAEIGEGVGAIHRLTFPEIHMGASRGRRREPDSLSSLGACWSSGVERHVDDV